MDHPMTEEESYADRRQLFKNIWDTAITIEKKDEENKDGNGHKPKVIKTARLDEVNQCIIGKKKKQRLKNLKIVCNKLLDFCDRQDTDDVFYAQMAMKDRQSRKDGAHIPKKSRSRKGRKTKKAKIMFTAIEDASETRSTSPDTFLKPPTSRNSSPAKIKGTSLSVQENYRKREKRNRVQTFPGTKMLIHASRKYSNKRLFPINKIYIH